MHQTVLIADDSLPLHTLVKAQLGTECLRFHSVYDGAAAMSSAVAIQPDLILLDVDMPRADGFQACQYLKSNPLTAAIPVVFLSADSMLADKAKGMNLGALDYIIKPFKSNRLKATVNAALRGIPISEDSRMAEGLPGLWNRSYFPLHLKSHLTKARASGRPLSCTVADMDQWDVISAMHGKGVAKELVRNAARAFLLRSRLEDTMCRFDAGRLVILSGDMNRLSAAKMVERLRADLPQKFTSAAREEVTVTYSFGISDNEIATGDALLKRATTALGRAIQRGGNRVVVARDIHLVAHAA